MFIKFIFQAQKSGKQIKRAMDEIRTNKIRKSISDVTKKLSQDLFIMSKTMQENCVKKNEGSDETIQEQHCTQTMHIYNCVG